MWSVAESPRVAEQCDVNIQSINQASKDSLRRSHGQVTRATPDLAPSPSPNFHTTPTGGRLSIDINVHRLPLQGGSSAAQGLTHGMPTMSL
ncbi:hypothetical protein TNCV_1053491 [Trichonephila clavipes]|nr:hypothetical protein TNCV_1053491 [Trichonephila clavipes]